MTNEWILLLLVSLRIAIAIHSFFGGKMNDFIAGLLVGFGAGVATTVVVGVVIAWLLLRKNLRGWSRWL